MCPVTSNQNLLSQNKHNFPEALSQEISQRWRFMYCLYIDEHGEKIHHSILCLRTKHQVSSTPVLSSMCAFHIWEQWDNAPLPLSTQHSTLCMCRVLTVGCPRVHLPDEACPSGLSRRLLGGLPWSADRNDAPLSDWMMLLALLPHVPFCLWRRQHPRAHGHLSKRKNNSKWNPAGKMQSTPIRKRRTRSTCNNSQLWDRQHDGK